MKIQENNIENKKVVQIYLSKKENDDSGVKEKISQIRAKKINVVVFVSGDNEAKETLKQMVKTMQKQ